MILEVLKKMNKEFFEAVELMEKEKGIQADYLYEKISNAIVVAVRRDYNGKDVVACDIDPEKKTMRVYLHKNIVDEIEDEDTDILVEDAKKYREDAKAGEVLEIELDTMQFGRIAAQTAKHVIRQGIKEAERGQVIREFQSKSKDLVTAKVSRIDPINGNVTLEIGKGSAVLPKSEQVPGETFTVSFTANPEWMGVTEAIGAMYLLVNNGTAIQGGFPSGNAPRTAIGLKANGEVVLYTVDGRQSGYSMGSSMNVLAQRMAELGCVTAICLDGGGSTTMVSATPDSSVSQLINSPSDGSQRKVSNHLLLIASGMPTNIPHHVYLSASAPVVLAGHTVELTANVVDSAYFPMSGQPVTLTASSGVIEGNTFIAPAQGGTVTITATSGGMSATVNILVIDSPDSMTIKRGNSAISSLTMVPGSTAELSVSVVYNHMELETTPADFIWSVDPALGTIDENGVLRTSYTERKGTITVTKGTSTVTIPLTVDADSPFVDTEGHWGSAYMAALYHQGVLTGVTEGDQLYAYPDQGVTRKEFAVLLSRYMGINTADYASVEVPFADMDQVDTWATDAVRAMYALGIVGGSTVNGQQVFDPNSILTRAQAVTMLGRMQNTEGIVPADLSVFSDAASVPSYALEHFQTMVSLGVISGNDGKLDPNGTMTRAAICKILATMP